MRLLVNAVGATLGGAARHLQPFLTALHAVEPSWRLQVYVTQSSLDLVSLGLFAEVTGVEEQSVWGRLVWDAATLPREARATRSDCIVNLTNHGPFWRCDPSILYQRNSLYFDRSWVDELSIHARISACARRLVAFRQIAAADVVITPTDAMASYLRSWLSSPRRFHSVTVPHAVDASRFDYRPRPLRTLHGAHLAVVSHPAPHKGLDTAVRVVGELKRRGYDVELTLTVARQGYARRFQNYVDGVAALTRELGVADRVEFAGATVDVQALYHRASVVLVPSLTESFGFPLLEAMATGVPVLASAIPALTEVAGRTAFWFRPGDHVGACNELAGMAGTSREEGSRRLQEARRAAEELTWERNATAVASVVRRCVATGCGEPEPNAW